MADPENLFAEALGDAKVQKINSRAKLSKYALDTSLMDEIRTFVIFSQEDRTKFEPNSAEDLKGLIDDMASTQAYRDRLTGILIESSTAVDELNILLKTGEAYLFTEYADVMKKCSNKESRDGAARFVFRPIFTALERWKSLKGIAEIATTNLNNTYFVIREIGENGRTILDARKIRSSFDV